MPKVDWLKVLGVPEICHTDFEFKIPPERRPRIYGWHQVGDDIILYGQLISVFVYTYSLRTHRSEVTYVTQRDLFALAALSDRSLHRTYLRQVVRDDIPGDVHYSNSFKLHLQRFYSKKLE